jgi:hypothetical protein
MSKGKSIRLSGERKIITEVINLARKIPMAPIATEMNLTLIDNLRKQVTPRVSWAMIMMKAYSYVANEFPFLRQVYIPWPTAHLYEHPSSVCSIALSRKIDGQERLFCARFNQPDQLYLWQLQEQYNCYRRRPIEQIKQFKHQMRFAKVPSALRKLGWSLMTGWLGRYRVNQMGTFGMSLSRFRKSVGYYHLGPLTTILGYEIDPDPARVRVTITFDHRIVDARPVIAALERLEKILLDYIRGEFETMIEEQQQQSIMKRAA